MRRITIVMASTLLLVSVSASARAVPSGSPTPLSLKRVVAALRTSGLTVLPNLALELPKGELMDYGFSAKGQPVLSQVIVYPTVSRGRTAGTAYRHGFVTKCCISAPTRV